MVTLIKKYNIYLDEPTYFSKDSKNHYSDDTLQHSNLVMLLF